jgi:hypothetical protein
MESKTWRWIKADQSTWSKLSLEKEERKNKIQVVKAKV